MSWEIQIIKFKLKIFLKKLTPHHLTILFYQLTCYAVSLCYFYNVHNLFLCINLMNYLLMHSIFTALTARITWLASSNAIHLFSQHFHSSICWNFFLFFSVSCLQGNTEHFSILCVVMHIPPFRQKKNKKQKQEVIAPCEARAPH